MIRGIPPRLRRYQMGVLRVREDFTRCVAAVSHSPHEERQCRFRRCAGPDGVLCNRHAKLLKAGRPVRIPPIEEAT